MIRHRFTVTSPNGSQYWVNFRENPRAKRLILRLDPKSGEAMITAPSKRDFDAAKRFVQSRTDWLDAQDFKREAAPIIAPGAVFPFRGQDHRLTCSAKSGTTQIIDGTELHLDSPGSELTFADRIERFCKMEARKALNLAVDRHAANLGAQPNKVSIRDTKSRWGSCSSTGNLSFSWRLILTPDWVLDYVAAHEVSHLLEMNHSPAFWAHVKASYGPYDQARRWLRTHGNRLHAIRKV